MRRVVHDQFTPLPRPACSPPSHRRLGDGSSTRTRTMAIATVTHACDACSTGTTWSRSPSRLPPPDACPATPDYRPARPLVMADERRQSGYPGIADADGSRQDQDVRAGQRLTSSAETIGGRRAGARRRLRARCSTSRAADVTGPHRQLARRGVRRRSGRRSTADGTACQRSGPRPPVEQRG